MEFVAIPQVEIGNINGPISIKVTTTPGGRGREFCPIPGVEVGHIDDSVEVGVAAEIGRLRAKFRIAGLDQPSREIIVVDQSVPV